MASRTSFTEDEDSLLAKYIAKYNPSMKGRSGNNLYRTLCEDADNKWKWSQTHPWQSWRDRYCKNQRQFDSKIKKYQMKHDLLPGNESMDGESSEELLMSRDKRKRGHGREEKRARVKYDSGNQIPASVPVEPTTVIDQGKAVTNYTEDDPMLEDHITREELGVKEEDELGLPASTMKTSPYPDVKEPSSLTTEPYSHNVNENSMTERQRKPPITYQTSHRVVLADSQPVASTSNNQMISSSRRRKPVMKDDVFFEPLSPAQSAHSPRNIDRSKHRKPKLVEGPFGTRFASRRKSGGSVNESSEDEDTVAWPPPRRRNNTKGKGKAVEAADTVAGGRENEPDVFAASRRRAVDEQTRRVSVNDLDKGQGEVDDSSASVQRHWGRLKQLSHRKSFQEVNETPNERCLQVTSGPSHDTLDPDLATKSESGATMHQHEPRTLLPPRHSWTPNNTFQTTDEIIIRRHSMGNLREVRSSNPRRLDLRTEMVKRRFAASSPFTNSRGHSVASTMPYQSSPLALDGRAKPPASTDNVLRIRSSIPVADEDRNHIEFLGLNAAIEEIVRESGFLAEQVWRVYNHYRSIRRTKEWIRLYRKNSARVQELTHEQMVKSGLGALDSGDEQRTSWPSLLEYSRKGETSTEHTLSTPETQESWLKIKPMPADLQHMPSDYSPPHETRAGEYNRLVGQGRVEEAMLREHRRASGSGGVFPRLRCGTPHQGSSGGDAETVEREEHDIEDVDMDNDERSKSRAELQKEEEVLFMSACAGMTDRLREIEEKMDPDYMLRWVAARLGGMADEFRSSL
ncbi:hypothetical protein C0992_010804 [Termitomyces sp. T32_za158]|nr:hypothetical protein C0992_010804 [Termitomyces sp. T32_za158]